MVKKPKVPETEDQYVLNPDGTVTIVVDGDVWTMRRPKVGEYGKLRERLWALQDEKTVITDRHRMAAAEHAKELAKGDADPIEQVLAPRRAAREMAIELEELNNQWIREAFDLLADSPAPEATDIWPTWMRESGFISRLVEHWRSVP